VRCSAIETLAATPNRKRGAMMRAAQYRIRSSSERGCDAGK
jgi:hypothetical protein